MKRCEKKQEVMNAAGVGGLPKTMQREEYFARSRGKHARVYMRFIARKGAATTNAKRKAA